LSDNEDAAAAEESPERPAAARPQEDDPGRDAPANGSAADPAGTEPARWDGNAAQVPRVVDASSAASGDEESTDSQDVWLRHDPQKSKLRAKIPEGSYFRDVRDVVAGEVHHHYYQSRQEGRGPGRIPLRDLLHASHVHVKTTSDTDLGEVLTQQQVAFCRGAPGTGRSQSATVVLDRLTGFDRSVSKVIVLDPTPGLDGLPGQLEAGCGHLLDGSEVPWAETVSRAQLNRFRVALGHSGFLVILLGADDGTPLAGPAVDHVGPVGLDLGKVAAFHLAIRLLDEDPPPDREGLTRARAQARVVIEEACEADGKTQAWYQELTHGSTAGPTEAVLFAGVIGDWHRRRQLDADAMPRVVESRGRHRYEQAAGLLRRNDATDSPLRQSFALSAAVLDGLALSEVIDGAAKLAALLAEVEHPGEAGQREVFAQPLARWLRHVDMALPKPGEGDRDRTVLVKMPSRELARAVIELAWSEYDAVRIPVLDWLMTLGAQHRDDRVRIRAVQALAYIAAHDYPLIKQHVLDVWSSKGSRPVERLAASWLLEAMVLDGAAADRVTDLLRHWARSEFGKRAVAVRAYGTAIASRVPEDAIQGVRISAVLPVGLGSLPEMALCEMYRLGLTREVTEELTQWMQGFPAMRERAGLVLVRISQFHRIAEGESDGPYDLLCLMATTPDKLGASMTQLAELWLLACSHENERLRSAAWLMLGRWAQSCRKYPDLGVTFTALADEFEKAAGGDDLRGRLSVYRRRWNNYLVEETQK
jgi:diadenosine tetraphosphatase ApaH/serine/threonine PP2A family protein phosphatase